MLLGALVVFLLETLYVTIMTSRWIILIRGYRYTASSVSFFEQLLYITALGLVVSQIDDIYRIIGYALGYAVGSIIGSVVEDRLAIGYTMLLVVSSSTDHLSDKLHGLGFGATSWSGNGNAGRQDIVMIVVKRRVASGLIEIIKGFDDKVFLVRIDTDNLVGGYFPSFKRGKLLKFYKPSG